MSRCAGEPWSERLDKLSLTFFMQFIFRFLWLGPSRRGILPSRVCLGLGTLGILLASQGAARSTSSIADGTSVEKFTGGHTRVVWVTDAHNKDSFAERNQLQLVGYDSRDGKGERMICAERANYYRPLITPDGERIVFSNQTKPHNLRRQLGRIPSAATKGPRLRNGSLAGSRDGENLGLLPGEPPRFHKACPPLSHR